LDLCASDNDYRERSISELQRVINITRELQTWFKGSDDTLIVTNVGGFSMNQLRSTDDRYELYGRLLQSLGALDTNGVEVIPQTMTPFPWHFGGQRYHNIFVHPDEICAFCQGHGYRICLDVSHSKLACNNAKLNFSEFLHRVGPYTAHLHIADAEGVDGEGLQVGEGELDFSELGAALAHSAPNARFIPEIWQGHKNNGEGFWVALERLEGHL
jgi:N-acetylneuraminate synthase